MSPRINKADPHDRKWLRDWLSESDSVRGLYLDQIAADRGCAATRDSIIASLDVLDGGAS